MGIEFGPILRVEMNGVDITPYVRRWSYRVMDSDGIRRHVVWLIEWPLTITGDNPVGDILRSRRCFTRRGAERLGRRWVRDAKGALDGDA